MKEDQSVDCDSVFQVGGNFPYRTYVDLSPNITREIRDTIDKKTITLVHGRSKCGKTSTVMHALRYIKTPIAWLQGALIRRVDDFWQLLAQELAQQFPQTTEEDPSSPDQLTTKLTNFKYSIVLDDFHWIATAETRAQLAAIFKYLSDQQIPIIIIGVSSPQMRDLDKTDIMARTNLMSLPTWTDGDLVKIGTKGFSQLNRRFTSLETLAQESFGSPFLMQLLCQLYCNAVSNSESRPFIENVDVDIVYEILPVASRRISAIKVYDILTQPTSCAVDDYYTRHDGRLGTLNQMVLYAIAGSYPEGAMPYAEVHVGRLIHRVNQVLNDQSESVTVQILFETLSLMLHHYQEWYETEAVNDLIRQDPAIDLVGQKLYIRDPFLLFYIRNSPEVEDQFA